MELKLFGQIGISLLLGLLIGLQRQRTESTIGGIRTFPLIAAFGTICGWLALEHGGWVIAAGLVALAALLVVSNFMMARAGNHDAGQTTEIAALLMFGVGAYVVVGEARGGGRARRRDCGAPALQGSAACLRGSHRRARRHRDHAVRPDLARDPAGAAQPVFGPYDS